MNWNEIFVMGMPLVEEKVFRVVLVYFFLIIGLRVAGKRELAQLNPFDLIVLLTLSNTLQNAIIGNDNTLTGGMIGAAALLALNYGVVRFVHHSKFAERLLSGNPKLLVRNGRVISHRCEAQLITVPELEAAARKEGIGSLKEVEKAILEPTGTISFIERRPSSDQSRHNELRKMIQELSRDLADLRKGNAKAG